MVFATQVAEGGKGPADCPPLRGITKRNLMPISSSSSLNRSFWRVLPSQVEALASEDRINKGIRNGKTENPIFMHWEFLPQSNGRSLDAAFERGFD